MNREQEIDYIKDSVRFDRLDDCELIPLIRRGGYIRVSDVMSIFQRLCVREEFRYSDFDWGIYGQTMLDDLEEEMRSGNMVAYADPIDLLPQDASVLQSDFVDFLLSCKLPDGGGDLDVCRHEVKVTPRSTNYDGGQLGAVQEFMESQYPLRTPSVDVDVSYVPTSIKLNLKRPLLLAIGYAPEIEGIDYALPKVVETLREREYYEELRLLPRRRVYRGVEY